MLRFVVAFTVVACAFGAVLPPVPRDDGGRIVGGEEAEISDVPWQVALLYDGSGTGYYSLRCGGSIVNERVIITAAHCVDGTNAKRWRIRAGSKQNNNGGQVVDVDSLTANERYDPWNIDYDMASMILSDDIDLDGVNARAVPLAKANAQVDDGATALISGWGSTFSGGSVVGNLRMVKIPVVNQQDCIKAYGGTNSITDRMICAGNLRDGGKDACQGDSGGPLVVDGVLHGVTSWGRGCASPGYPGVWARVSSMRQWFDDSVK